MMEQLFRVDSRFRQSAIRSLLVLAILLSLVSLPLPTALAQSKAGADEPLSSEKIEQLVAPIALHPDPLLTQILMSSTYPLEVVQAARWAQKNSKVSGKQLEDAMAKLDWDPSVKSLTAFPQVLQMMNDELGWTQQLGNAFLAQQQDVLDAVQRLRKRADKEGNLKATKEQTVKKQKVESQGGGTETVIIIKPADPKVIYVPAYNPTVIYGTWPYVAYPPYYWYPPGYVARRAFWFGVGVTAGSALWGHCNWRHGNISINVNKYNNFNRSKITSPKWNHNPRHRRAVPYKGRDVAKRYGQGRRDVRSREQFRGRAKAGRKDLVKRPDVGKRPGAGKRPTARKTPKSAARPKAKKARPAAKRTKRSTPARKPAAYQGIGKGKQVRRNSKRGSASRKVSRSRPSRGGGGRGGGGRGGGRRR
jgi:uncharacterized membrane protein YgcG